MYKTIVNLAFTHDSKAIGSHGAGSIELTLVESNIPGIKK